MGAVETAIAFQRCPDARLFNFNLTRDAKMLI